MRRVSSCKGCDFDSLLPDCSPRWDVVPPARPPDAPQYRAFLNGNSRGYTEGAWKGLLCQRSFALLWRAVKGACGRAAMPADAELSVENVRYLLDQLDSPDRNPIAAALSKVAAKADGEARRTSK